MKYAIIFFLSIMSILGFSQEKQVHFVIETPVGNMTGVLYNDTPQHRDNFVKLIKEGWYDGSPFHRIIKDFMIQGGQNKDGQQDPGYKVPAEFIPEKYIHKKGALAAARMGDQVNPTRASSGSQFYIVQGRIVSDDILKRTEMQITQQIQKPIIMEFLKRPENKDIFDKVMKYQKERRNAELNVYINQIIQLIEAEGTQMDKFAYTDKQKAVYRTIGGTPHLDGAYTVFGEIISGMDVIDKLAAVPTGPGDKPIEDISMKIKLVE